jgi:hypothetical protein
MRRLRKKRRFVLHSSRPILLEIARLTLFPYLHLWPPTERCVPVPSSGLTQRNSRKPLPYDPIPQTTQTLIIRSPSLLRLLSQIIRLGLPVLFTPGFYRSAPSEGDGVGCRWRGRTVGVLSRRKQRCWEGRTGEKEEAWLSLYYPCSVLPAHLAPEGVHERDYTHAPLPRSRKILSELMKMTWPCPFG